MRQYYSVVVKSYRIRTELANHRLRHLGHSGHLVRVVETPSPVPTGKRKYLIFTLPCLSVFSVGSPGADQGIRCPFLADGGPHRIGRQWTTRTWRLFRRGLLILSPHFPVRWRQRETESGERYRRDRPPGNLFALPIQNEGPSGRALARGRSVETGCI